MASSEVVRAQLLRDGFFLFPATPSGRALANRVREVVAAAKASDFELVASSSRWQGVADRWTALAPVARAVQRLVALHVRDEALQSTEPLPFLAPPWAKGQQPHHDLDEQLRALSWLFSLTDVPEVNATQFFPGSHDASTYPLAPAEDVGRAAPRTAAPAAPTGALLFLSTLTHRGQSMGKDHQARVFGYVTSRKGGPNLKAPTQGDVARRLREQGL